MEFKTVGIVNVELSEEEKNTLIEAGNILKELASNLREQHCPGILAKETFYVNFLIDSIGDDLQEIARNPIDVQQQIVP